MFFGFAGVKNLTLRFPPTAVPAAETSYYCMIFDLAKHGDFHLVATNPVVDNRHVMHHMLLFGCDERGKSLVDVYLINKALSLCWAYCLLPCGPRTLYQLIAPGIRNTSDVSLHYCLHNPSEVYRSSPYWICGHPY